MPQFEIVDTPEPPSTPRGKRVNPVLLALVRAAAELPDGKSIRVNPQMFGWKAQGNGELKSYLTGQLKRISPSIIPIRSDDGVFVTRANGRKA